MARLTSEAEELVRAGREALRPSDADRERVFQALMPQLGPITGPRPVSPPEGRRPQTKPVSGPSSVPPAAAKGTLVKLLTVLVGFGVVSAGLYLALRKEPPPARPAAITPPTPAVVPPAPVDPVPESAPIVTPQPESVEKRTPVAPRPANSLAEEVAILSRASAELHAGRPAAALTVLDEHRRKFPRGVLAQERSSARVQALCALGRMKEAQAELARLERISPNSPHVARARKACGSGLTEKE